jgi:hypothetical protein
MKPRQTGQANARTDSIVAVRTGRPYRFSRYRYGSGECRNVVGQNFTRQTYRKNASVPKDKPAWLSQ